jgi:hypothetical protein
VLLTGQYVYKIKKPVLFSFFLAAAHNLQQGDYAERPTDSFNPTHVQPPLQN